MDNTSEKSDKSIPNALLGDFTPRWSRFGINPLRSAGCPLRNPGTRKPFLAARDYLSLLVERKQHSGGEISAFSEPPKEFSFSTTPGPFQLPPPQHKHRHPGTTFRKVRSPLSGPLPDPLFCTSGEVFRFRSWCLLLGSGLVPVFSLSSLLSFLGCLLLLGFRGLLESFWVLLVVLGSSSWLLGFFLASG